jgi:hypothetical protein
VDISEKSWLGEFTVGNDVDAAFRLLPHNIVHRLREQRLEFFLVVGLAGVLRLH